MGLLMEEHCELLLLFELFDDKECPTFQSVWCVGLDLFIVMAKFSFVIYQTNHPEAGLRTRYC